MSEQQQAWKRRRLFSYLFYWLPMLIWFALLLVGVLASEGGRSPFLENGLTMMALGACAISFGLSNVTFAGELAADEQTRQRRWAARHPRLDKLFRALAPRASWYYGPPEGKVAFHRLGGILFALVGFVIFGMGVWRL